MCKIHNYIYNMFNCNNSYNNTTDGIKMFKHINSQCK